MSDFNISITEAIQKAEKEGFTIIRSTPDTLLLDLDTPEQLTHYTNMLPEVQKNFGVYEIDRWRSRNQNLHILIQCPHPLLQAERIALQACLGSDPKKEMLAILRLRNTIPGTEVSLLFKPKLKDGGITSFILRKDTKNYGL